MKLKCDNRVLVEDQPKSILTSSITSGSTSLTVKNTGGFSQNDYVLIGKIGEDKTEIKRISSSVSAGSSLTVVALIFDHDEDTVITKLDYDQVQFARAATEGGSKSALTTIDIEPSEIYTYYEDTTNSTGYGFIRLKDSNDSSYSNYSDAISYTTGYGRNTLRMMRKKTRRLLGQVDEGISDVSNDEIDDEINIAQEEIGHLRRWSFMEDIWSFSSVANQWEYDLTINMYRVFEAKYDSQPLAVAGLSRMNALRWDTDVTGDPTHLNIWKDKARVYPYPSSSADTTTLNGGLTDSASTITVASTSDFRDQGRLIINDEVISYTGKTSTTFTGCSRAEEETTASSHSDGDTVTERDFMYYGQKEPNTMRDEGDTTDITDPNVVIYKAASELALGPIEDKVLHDSLLIKYERALQTLKGHDEPKVTGSPLRVKDYRNTVYDGGAIRDPNDPPTNLGT